VSDIVEMGGPEPDRVQPISYPVGPGQLRRMFDLAALPPALGVAALALSVTSLIVIQSGNELGDAYVIAHGTQNSLLVYQWATGVQMAVAAFATVLAVIGIRLLLGRRPKLTVQPADFEADDKTVDELEAAALARVDQPPAWMSTLLGSSLVVSLVALGINAAVFGYAMAAHPPAPPSPFPTF
jgi:hypothetical protein